MKITLTGMVLAFKEAPYEFKNDAGDLVSGTSRKLILADNAEQNLVIKVPKEISVPPDLYGRKLKLNLELTSRGNQYSVRLVDFEEVK